MSLMVKFNKKQDKFLVELSKKLDTDISGVLKKALSLLDIAVQENDKKNFIGIINRESDEITEITGIFEREANV